ncbi:MAG: cold shock domain-containing protein [Candidatus Bathyarchaeota archaeon]
MKGIVKKWLQFRGYGFIKPDEGKDDVFVHHSEIGGSYDLKEGQKVNFEVESTHKGPRAINVTLVE